MSANFARRGMLLAALVLSTMLLPGPARADTVTHWNEIATNALVADGQGAAALAHLAMVHGAVFDAVTAIDGRYEPYLEPIRAKRWYSQDAAVATAAYRVLVDSQPPVVSSPERLAALAASLRPEYDAALAAIPPGPAKDGGVATGNAAADEMIAARRNDGRFGAFRFSVGTLAGQWRPVLPLFVNDPGAWLKDVRPFLVRNSSQFDGREAYQLTSRRYAKEFDEVKAIGATNSTTRTPDQTLAAQFWGLANGVGTWSRLYRNIAEQHGESLADNARMFAMVYLAGADTAITVWADKAKFSFWRPITAIREAAGDGNPRTVADPNWLPLIATPPYPDQPSGLSALASASARALQGFFGTDDVAFTGTITNAPGTISVTRSYTSFSQAAREIVDARVWSGLHFRNADEQGALIGDHVARWQAHRFPQVSGHDHDHDHDGR
jgi:hypothetical protein